MKLLLIYPAALSNVFFTPWVKRIQSTGPDIIICSNTLLSSDNPFPSHTTVHHVSFPRGSNPGKHLLAAQALNDVVKRVEPDVIHAHFSASLFTTALAKGKSWPVTIGTFHGISYPLLHSGYRVLIGGMERWAAKRLKHIIVLNQKDRDVLKHDIPDIDLYMAGPYGLGCDLVRFDPARFTTADRVQLRQKLGISPNAPVAVFVGRFVNFKGFDCTIRAFRKVLNTCPEARLLCVGSFDKVHPTGLREDELDWAKSALEIIWAGWQQDVSPFLNVSDFVVFPSEREGMPVCLMEAQAMGLPCITTRTRGCEDIIEDGVTGILVHPSDDRMIFEAMQNLIQDSQQRSMMGLAALERRGRFDPAIGIKEHLKIYNRILSNSSKKTISVSEHPVS